MVTKYKVSDELKLKIDSDTVKMKIIFVPPLDGEGVQYYLCEVVSLYANGGEKHFYNLTEEKDIDSRFLVR